MAIILLNLLVGPPLFRQALVRVGEARAALGLLPVKDHGPRSLGAALGLGGPGGSGSGVGGGGGGGLGGLKENGGTGEDGVGVDGVVNAAVGLVLGDHNQDKSDRDQ